MILSASSFSASLPRSRSAISHPGTSGVDVDDHVEVIGGPLHRPGHIVVPAWDGFIRGATHRNGKYPPAGISRRRGRHGPLMASTPVPSRSATSSRHEGPGSPPRATTPKGATASLQYRRRAGRSRWPAAGAAARMHSYAATPDAASGGAQHLRRHESRSLRQRMSAVHLLAHGGLPRPRGFLWPRKREGLSGLWVFDLTEGGCGGSAVPRLRPDRSPPAGPARRGGVGRARRHAYVLAPRRREQPRDRPVRPEVRRRVRVPAGRGSPSPPASPADTVRLVRRPRPVALAAGCRRVAGRRVGPSYLRQRESHYNVALFLAAAPVARLPSAPPRPVPIADPPSDIAAWRRY